MKKVLSFWIIFIFFFSGFAGASATDVHYDRLVNKAAFQALDQPSVDLIQQNLAVIYRGSLDWDRDVDMRQRPLTDGLIGPVTLFWVQRFLFDFKIEPIGDFISDANLRLSRIASFASMFPEEVKVLLSADFAHWNDAHPRAERRNYYKIRRSGSDQQLLDLVDLYLRTLGAEIEPLQVGKSELVTYSYQLTTEDFKVLQSKKEILLLLVELENKHFDNFQELKEATEGVLADYPQQTKKLLPIIRQYFTESGITINQEIFERLSKWMADDLLFTSLNSTLVELLQKTLSGVAYPSEDLLKQSVRAKIAAGIGGCQIENESNDYVLGLKLSDDDFKKLSGELLLESIGTVETSPSLYQRLKRVKSLRRDVCSKEDVEDINKFNIMIYDSFVHPAISPLYRKLLPIPLSKELPFKQLPIQWDGDLCGCVLDDLAGTVYGFYPFWLADEKPQRVNFSVLSRVAYYGLSFDAEGAIKQTNADGDDASAIHNIQNEFIQKARQHDSRVDWVIHNDKPYWEAWKGRSGEDRARLFKVLAKNIVNLLTEPLTDEAFMMRRILTTFGMKSPPTRGDGVTLYFNGYPEDDKSEELFNNFVQDLREKLDEEDEEYAVNIMVQQEALSGKGAYQYTNLLEHIFEDNVYKSGKDANYNLKSKVLVLVDEPSHRARVKGFSISESKRNIIPVVVFDGKNWDQLNDDLTYFEDNFDGVGFWPLFVNEPVDEDGMAKEGSIEYLLERSFQKTQIGGADNIFDRFVCENRWSFYMALAVFIIMTLIFIGYYFWSCSYREHVKKYFPWYVAAFSLLIILIPVQLALHAPYFEAMTKEYRPYILGSFIIIASFSVYLFQRRMQKVKAKKPSRRR